MSDPAIRWAIQWRSQNNVDGRQEYILWREGMPMLFHTRRAARQFVKDHYAYIQRRKDLRTEPHGWRMPQPVRVWVRVEKP